MRKHLKELWLLLLAFAFPLSILAQVAVSGRVTSPTGIPVSGASVKVRNSNAGTTTDADGKFSINLPNAGGALEISAVGFRTQIVSIASAQSDLAVKLEDDVARLDEVVVTGLASSLKRTNLANSVASISAKDLNGTVVQPTMDAALYGKFTGANISANSGAPGGGISVKLRGITSLVANSQPLFIVDGVFYDNSAIPAGLNSVSKAAGQGSIANQDNPSNRIADLDPEDIDRIEILKGASAAAIYGSRAAGGVVIITTKRGKAGKPRIEISQTIGVQMQLRKLGQRTWDRDKALDAFGPSAGPLFDAANGQFFNYEDELYGNKGLMSTTRVGVSGGSERTTYYAGFTYKNDEGIVERTGYRKTSVRLNLTQKVTNFIDLDVNTNYIDSKADRGYFNNDNTATTMGVSFVSTPSWVNLYPDENGNYPNNPLAPSNFIQTRDLITNSELVNRFLLGASATLKILKNNRHEIKVIGRGGIDYFTLNTRAIFPPELQFQKEGNGTNGASIYGTTIARNNNYDAVVLYDFSLNEKMNFRTQAGVAQAKVYLDNVLNTATQLIGTQTNLDQAGSIQVEEAKTIQTDRGFFVQEEFNFNDFIIATLGLRGDKSSRNGDPDKIYYYPKASAAVNIHRISSWNSDLFSQLKVRAAYGESGNFAPFGAIYSPLAPVNFNSSTGSLIGLTRGDEFLKPERQIELEMGADVGLLKNKLVLEFTYYIKKAEDLLLQVEVAPSTGFSTAWKNVGNIENKGVEIALNANPVNTTNWKWTSRLNFWTNSAEVTRLDVPAFNTGAFGATLGTYRIEQGKSPTQLVGIDDTKPAGELTVFGDAEPDFQMSWFNFVSWKKLEFSVLMHWKSGGENINLSTFLFDLPNTTPDFDDKTLDPTGQVNNGDYRLSKFGSTARYFIEDASYFRVRELGVSYTLPKSWFRNIAAVKLGFSARNLINIFDYYSYDPEVSNFGSNAISSNVEVTPFPSAKSVHFNVSVLF